jgi:hypothetical protein
MPKKRVAVSLRKPSPAPDSAVNLVEAAPVAVTPPEVVTPAEMTPMLAAQPEVAIVEAFVNGAVEALDRAVNERPSEVRELIQRGPDALRELTLFLPEQLARDLALHCSQHDLDPSRLVARALEQYLLTHADTPYSRQLRKLARALLRDLAQRARAFWQARRAGGLTAVQAAAG